MSRVNDNILFEDVKIVFRNFEGAEGKYNRAGDRNFCIILEDPELVRRMESDGWNVRYLQPREEGMEEQPYLPVKVEFDKGIPPKITMISSKGKTLLNRDTVGLLDVAEFETIDVLIRPYNWSVSGKEGVKAYVKTMFVTLAEDDLEKKYFDVDTSTAICIGDDCPVIYD